MRQWLPWWLPPFSANPLTCTTSVTGVQHRMLQCVCIPLFCVHCLCAIFKESILCVLWELQHSAAVTFHSSPRMTVLKWWHEVNHLYVKNVHTPDFWPCSIMQAYILTNQLFFIQEYWLWLPNFRWSGDKISTFPLPPLLELNIYFWTLHIKHVIQGICLHFMFNFFFIYFCRDRSL